MSNAFELTATQRALHGTSACRRMRRHDNSIPAIVYGTDKQPESITLNHDQIVVALENEAFYSHILTLNIDGKAQEAVLKNVQRHPYKHKILHVDFMRIKAGEKITMSVPLHFQGEEQAPGVKQQGGAVSHLITEVEVMCLPKNLPEAIDVDVSQMEVGTTLHLSDLKLPKGVEILALAQHHDSAVVSIQAKKAVAEEEPEATAGDTTAESTEAKADDAKEEKSE
ncbi:MAG: 50S ribosomal protein L25/general stress protein Ctc [Legionellaceae bacterium]|nr:50S ribosomal protein L25/general stress protein Ctc [Legionellaceae bacterium]